ncbi:MAG: MoaD/ThiS family protein [Anaerolineae bacterium]|nr:MoaD/ThiS family protein [Anaerolineae bacterium]
MATVWIPSLMRTLSGGRENVSVPGQTVGEVIEALDTVCPGIKDRLCHEERIDPAIAVWIDGRIAPLGLIEAVAEQSEILFLPAVAGG